MPSVSLSYKISDVVLKQTFDVESLFSDLRDLLKDLGLPDDFDFRASELDYFEQPTSPEVKNTLQITMTALESAKRTQEVLDQWSKKILDFLKEKAPQSAPCSLSVIVETMPEAGKDDSGNSRKLWAFDTYQPAA